MNHRELLLEAFGRIDTHVDEILDRLPSESLHVVIVPGTNPIGWLLWHLVRQWDVQLAAAFGTTQVWVDGDWATHFDTDPSPSNLGYGHTAEQVAAFHVAAAEDLRGYERAVAERTRELLRDLDADALDRIIDRRWDPPVTLGVRLVSVVDDAVQHAGQAKYLRGQLERRTG